MSGSFGYTAAGGGTGTSNPVAGGSDTWFYPFTNTSGSPIFVDTATLLGVVSVGAGLTVAQVAIYLSIQERLGHAEQLLATSATLSAISVGSNTFSFSPAWLVGAGERVWVGLRANDTIRCAGAILSPSEGIINAENGTSGFVDPWPMSTPWSRSGIILPIDLSGPTTGTFPPTDVREALIVDEPVIEGTPEVRVALALDEPVAEGNPEVRVALAIDEPVAEGNPEVRVALIVVETLIDIPEEGPLATAVFPTLKGLTWDIHKNPEFNTGVRQATSGKETRTPYRAYPIWHFELSYTWLPDYVNASGYQQSDYRTLEGFFLGRRGKTQAWLFRDPDDYRVRGGTIATGDAVTLQWAFARQFSLDEPDYLEPVGQIDLSVLASFAATAVNTTTDAINIPLHGLTNGEGPVFLSNTGGALPTGLAAGTPYWVIVVDADHIKLATNQPNALAGTGINITAQGSGTDTLTKGWAVYETVAETDAVPSSGPYTITVAHAAAFVSDGGVTIAGAALTRVGSSPAANQYAVSATGTYTFNSAQASASASITYSYLATNVSLAGPNQLIFAVAPADEALITADFDFWFVCRFEEDVTEMKQFASKFWDLEQLTFQSVL